MRIKLLDHQLQFINSKKPTTVMLCGRGAGKSYAASVLIMLYMMKGKSVIVTAQSYKLLTLVIFAAIKKRFGECSLTVIHEKQMCILRFGSGVCYGFSADSACEDSVRGLDDISAVVMDEAALAQKELCEIAEACMRGPGVKEPRTYLMTTPRGSANWVSERVLNDDCEVIRASSFANKTLNKGFFDMLQRDYSGDFYKQEVMGEVLCSDAVDQLISSLVIDNSVYRSGRPSGLPVGVGLDVARFGSDLTVGYGIWEGGFAARLFSLSKADSFGILTELRPWLQKGFTRLSVDGTGGFASGVVDMLNRENWDVDECNFGAASVSRNAENLRAELYVELKDAVTELELHIPDDDKLKPELAANRYMLSRTSGKIILLPKDEIRKSLGRSPDDSDALALAWRAYRNKPVTQDSSRLDAFYKKYY